VPPEPRAAAAASELAPLAPGRSESVPFASETLAFPDAPAKDAEPAALSAKRSKSYVHEAILAAPVAQIQAGTREEALREVMVRTVFDKRARRGAT
jgi:hypothetical protein